MMDMIKKCIMSFSNKPTPEAIAAAQLKVDEAISNHKIVIISKTSCPYCSQAKTILKDQTDIIIFELNTIKEGNAIQTYIATKLNVPRVTVPQIFISGKAIGGCSDLQALQTSGKLAELLI